MVHNNDGLLDIPQGLASHYQRKGNRYIKMVTLTKEDKIKGQIALSQQKMQQHIDKQKKLQKELEKAEKAAQGMSQREIELAEMRAEIERIYQEQAQQFINQHLAKAEEELKQQYEEKFNQRVNVSFNPILNQANVDMTDENSQSIQGTSTLDNTGFGSVKMGTRRKPTDIGRVPNTIRNKVSNESSFEPSQFQI